MKWKSTENDEKNQIFDRKCSPDGKLFMGVYSVLFGARIRAGYVGSPVVLIDWCCGEQLPIVALTYHMLLQHVEAGGTLEELPSVSTIKPWYNDGDFIAELEQTLKEKPTP
jgi:hypothetical protein